jgi:hypothetical protein
MKWPGQGTSSDCEVGVGGIRRDRKRERSWKAQGGCWRGGAAGLRCISITSRETSMMSQARCSNVVQPPAGLNHSTVIACEST